MRITQWGEYGVHFCLFLAEQHSAGVELVGATQITENQGIKLEYAQQVLQRLRKGGVISSIRGPQGGYKLANPANSITLREILVAAEGDAFEVICDSKPISPERCGEGSNCGLRLVWKEMQEHIDEFLLSYSLEDLANKYTSTKENSKLVTIGITNS